MRHRKKRLGFGIGLGLALAASAAAAVAARDAGIGCRRLHIALDAGLSPDAVEREWGSGNDRSGTPAVLELLGCDGRVLDRMVLESPLARLDPVALRGAPHPTWLVSADLTAEAGSYSGPLTLAIQVVHDRLTAAVARRADGGTEPIRLVLSGKSAWRRVADRSRDELLFVASRPAEGGFVTSWRRYFPLHRTWQVKVRTTKGLWESDGPFPGRGSFP